MKVQHYNGEWILRDDTGVVVDRTRSQYTVDAWRERMRTVILDYIPGADGGPDSRTIADALIAAGFGDVSTERERAERAELQAGEAWERATALAYEVGDLQARIDAALAVPHGPFGPWDDDLCEYEQVRAALVSEEPSSAPPISFKSANRGQCEECQTNLEIDTIMRNGLEVFCPNKECPKFVKTFWIER